MKGNTDLLLMLVALTLGGLFFAQQLAKFG